MNQHDIMLAMAEHAAASKGNNAHAVLEAIAPEYDELWTAIKMRVVYIMDTNEDHIQEHGDTLLPVATWLDGFATAMRLVPTRESMGEKLYSFYGHYNDEAPHKPWETLQPWQREAWYKEADDLLDVPDLPNP